MINYDFLTLNAFLKENSDFFTGARIQKIQQPTRQELLFTLRNLGETRKFYVNINPKFFHVCFTSGANEKKRLLEIPKQPPMFCMLLRKYIESSKIAKVEQPQGERILEFYFETYNEIGDKIYLCLAIELMGKHSNIILYNYDTNVIIGGMHNIGAEKSSVREVIGGLPYAYPPKSNHTNFKGLSSILPQNIPINDAVDNYFADLQQKDKIKNLESKLSTLTKSKLKKTNSSLEKVEKQSSTNEKADSHRKKADLIISNLYNNKDFSKFIEVIDYETGEKIKIKLDETKTLKENANHYYKLYNKAKISNEKSAEMIENLKREKEYLEQVLYSIEEAQTVEDLMEIQEETGNREKGTEAKCKVQSAKNILSLLFTVYHLPFTIFVGKNNRQNDYIVSKLARDEDLWFHVHNCAGSHVLLRVESGQKVTDEVIFECAKLAKQYSSAKDSSKAGVIYTKAKHLKKPTGAPLGYVTYKGEKELIVD